MSVRLSGCPVVRLCHLHSLYLWTDFDESGVNRKLRLPEGALVLYVFPGGKPFSPQGGKCVNFSIFFNFFGSECALLVLFIGRIQRIRYHSIGLPIAVFLFPNGFFRGMTTFPPRGKMGRNDRKTRVLKEREPRTLQCEHFRA